MGNSQNLGNDLNELKQVMLGQSDGAQALNAALRKVLADGEELLRATANYSAEGWAVARDKFQSNLQDAKAKLSEAQSSMKDKASSAANATQEYTQENPWTALAIVGSVGMVIGLLMRGRHKPPSE